MLHAKYKGAGERPVEEVAGLVGFKLPKQYQEPPGDTSKKWHCVSCKPGIISMQDKFYCSYSTGAYQQVVNWMHQ